MTRALLLDFGGVLTPSVGRMFRTFETAHNLPAGTLFDAMAQAYGTGGEDSEIARLERGEVDLRDFERALAASFEALGHDVGAERLVARIFAGLDASGRLWDATGIARAAGVRTGLLSNSWATDGYPDDLLERYFDDIVISGAVGLRKPDPAIFHLAAERLEVAVADCVFVDDLEANVLVARELGMTGVVHTGDEDAVLQAVSEALDVDVTGARDVSEVVDG